MTMSNRLIILFLGLVSLSYGQERIADLTANPVIQDYIDRYGPLQKSAAGDTLDLPFYDDFSDDVLFPREDRWMDSYAYINLDMAFRPPSYGVATLDGLNEFGQAYNLVNSSSYGVADYLTSYPIDLDYLPSDSVYLSFYYQPQGIGNAPEYEDSLVLEFRGPDTLGWRHVWSTEGMDFTEFKAVYIPITDAAYLKRGFQFRFKNYATLSGNLDHWHLDYIILDEGRSRNDSTIDDICISQRPAPILEDYYSVPWTHFSNLNNPYRANNRVYFQNRASGVRNVNFGYRLFQDGQNIFNSNVLFKNSNPASLDSVLYIYQSNLENITTNSNDSSEVEVKYFIQSVPDVRPENDTLTFKQHFHNYYAYDDGTAERGYALNDLSAKMAYYLDPLKNDTLRGVELYFPPTLINATNNRFKIGIWTVGNDGAPSLALYKSDSIYQPRFTPMNYYARYLLDSALFIDQPVFIGIEQQFNDEMYVGFDRNYDNSDKLFYFVSGLWLPSEIEGSLMMRPMFGSRVTSDLGLDEVESSAFTVFPNPATQSIQWDGSDAEAFIIRDLQGREVLSGRGTQADIQNLSDGVYILIRENNGQASHARFVKLK